ncbi:VCBS repeat-containing protein [Crassaminicella profunda]|uniref:VCBS repeat-containing protein n=1 Tax=Crassaminicella profunda TaxID=1286698 RepID=UPI001CA64872|nr:VCBS repeat-containing protein [Crassaminicella profunda]QZY54858.1 VCBS repeat-containing protein [Crassaminicella profunda]
MKKRNWLKVSSALLLSSFLAFGSFHALQAKAASNTFKVGEKFTISELNMGNKAYIIDYKEADVTGDTTKDKVILVGSKEFSPEEIFVDPLTVVVQDGKTKKYSKATYEGFCGYIDDKPLFIGDFTGDQVKDVMVTAATGGSGGITNHMIVTFKDNKPEIIFDEKDNKGIEIEGKYIDGFKADITIKNIDKKILLDLSANKENYIESGIYDKSGKLLEKTEPFMGPFSLLKPIDYNCDGIYELKGGQRIAGTCNADTLSFIDSIFKYENSNWKVQELQYSTYLVK